MILGTGLIANAFLNSDFYHKCYVVFASGVSNSSCEDINEYKREYNLLKNTISSNVDKSLIYFSTTSIHTGKDSLYVEYKRKAERYIKKNCNEYLILRLPNIVGKSSNKSQLLPYFYDKLQKEEQITIDPTLKRYLVDVEDLPKIVKTLSSYVELKHIVDVYFSNEITVFNLVNYLQEISGKKYSEVHFKYGYEDSLQEKTLFRAIVEDKLDLFNSDPYKIIKKYYENFIPSVHE